MSKPGRNTRQMAGEIACKARAKINLALHVTGRRNDGYHLLDSFVVFADISDLLNIAPAQHTGLDISGLFGDGLPVENDNLVLQAFQTLSDAMPIPLPTTEFKLEKNLPVSSGIGGGSADAAAALNGLVDLWQVDIDRHELAKIALSLGADVPVCLAGHNCQMRGIGEDLTAIDDFPRMDCVLVNPGVGVSTPDVFKELALPSDQSAFSPLSDLPASNQAGEWIEWLGAARNDLQDAAIKLTPVIEQAIGALEQTGTCQLARMSGSGATCFGLFDNGDDARKAAEKIAGEHPDWWVVATQVGNNLKTGTR